MCHIKKMCPKNVSHNYFFTLDHLKMPSSIRSYSPLKSLLTMPSSRCSSGRGAWSITRPFAGNIGSGFAWQLKNFGSCSFLRPAATHAACQRAMPSKVRNSASTSVSRRQ